MVKTAFAYLDESGDLGWKLDLPYQHGGSSRHFIIAIAIGMNRGYRKYGKVIDKLHENQKWTSSKEKKWATIGQQARTVFCQLAAKELATNPENKVLVAVCHKENAPDFLRSVDFRLLNPHANENELQALEARYKGRNHLVYAMMVAETLAEYLPVLDKFSYCPDDLNEGQRILEHIITYRLLIQDGRKTQLTRVEKKKEMQRGLDFADMAAGAVFEAYEKGDTSFLNIIKPQIIIKDFHRPTSACAINGITDY